MSVDDRPAVPTLVGECLNCGRTVMTDMPRLTIAGNRLYGERVLHRNCAVNLHADLRAVLR